MSEANDDSDPLKIGFAVSAGVHLLLFICAGVSVGAGEGSNFVTVDMKSLEAVAVSESGAISMDSFANPSANAEEKAAEDRRRQYAEYLEQIKLEIHSHRLQFGRTDLVGISTFAFVVDKNGVFSAVEMVSGSGRPALDEIARKSVLASSGKVKRPKILGDHPLTIVQEVRFQYGLH